MSDSLEATKAMLRGQAKTQADQQAAYLKQEAKENTIDAEVGSDQDFAAIDAEVEAVLKTAKRCDGRSGRDSHCWACVLRAYQAAARAALQRVEAERDKLKAALRA